MTSCSEDISIGKPKLRANVRAEINQEPSHSIFRVSPTNTSGGLKLTRSPMSPFSYMNLMTRINTITRITKRSKRLIKCNNHQRKQAILFKYYSLHEDLPTRKATRGNNNIPIHASRKVLLTKESPT